MKTSLARRERRRRNGLDNPPPRGSAVRRIAIALPLFLFGTLVAMGVIGFVAVVGAFTYYSNGLPDPKTVFNGLTFFQGTTVYDRTGKTQLAGFAQEQRDVITWADLPPVLVDATTSIEDHSFWDNAGFDPIGLISSALRTRENPGGGSTITQQFVRSRLLPAQFSDAATNVYERKIREIIQSIRLTQEFPGADGKQRIITAYLNQNFYGNGSYGVAAAARGYWGITDLNKLDLAQAAILAAIPQSPTQYDLIKNAVEQTAPDGKTQQLVVPPTSQIVIRRNYILEQMKIYSVLTRGKYSAADYAAAESEPVILTPPQTQKWLAPQFVLQVRHQLGAILCGPDNADNCPKIDTGGYTVLTTLDYRMQQSAEKWVEAGARAPNAKNPGAYLKALKVPYLAWIRNLVGKGVGNAALATIDYRTGQVYAYAGSAGFYLSGNKKFQPQFDVLEDGWRQPGSAWKPINYGIGLDEKTMTAASLFMDAKTTFLPGWTPTDADLYERGPLRLRQAINVSLNIPAIKAGLEIGPDHEFQRAAQDFGIRWRPGQTAVASIGIGTIELHMIDLISAYGAIANGGILMPRTYILQVQDSSGKTIWPDPSAPAVGTPAMSPQAAFVMTDIIAGNTDPKQNPFWSKRALYTKGVRRPATLKTGTTNDTKDLTAVGYVAPPKDPNAPALVTGTWMGNSDNSAPPNGVMSLETAASLWQSYMTEITAALPIAQFQKPAGVVQVTVDAYSGMLPGPYSTKTIKEWFIAGTQPTQVDNTKVGIAVDAATGGLWQNGCAGPRVIKGFLDLSKIEANYPQWTKANQNWIARAARGGGRTTPFYEPGSFGWLPFGNTYGAPFPPSKTCTIPLPSPSPEPSGSPFPVVSPLPSAGP